MLRWDLGGCPDTHVAAFVQSGLLSELHADCRHPLLLFLTLSEAGKRILPADSLPVPIKDAAPDNSWLHQSFVRI